MDILKKLPDKSIDLILTDPPYIVDLRGGHGKGCFSKEAKKLKEGLKNIAFDFDYKTVFEEFLRVCKKPNFYIFCSNAQISRTMKYFEDLKLNTTLLTWWKYNACPLVNNNLMPDAEYIIFARKGVEINNIQATLKSRVIQMPMQPQDRIHPTQKPVDLMKRLLLLTSNENDLVLDCFSGSGTTAIACHRLKRRFICIEKDPEYWAASVKRLEEEKKQGTLF